MADALSLSGVTLLQPDSFKGVPPLGQGSGRPSLRLGPRVNLKVQYLTSGQYTTNAAALHFFQVEEGRDHAKKQRRLIVLVDKETFAGDLDKQVNRCSLISTIEEVGLFEEHLRPLSGPMTKFDDLLNATTPLDYVRIIPCIFSARDPANLVCMYELEEGQPISVNVNCRPATLGTEEGVVMRMQHEEVVRRLRDSHHHEVQRLREMVQKQKDGQLMELLDAKTQIEELRHSLSLSEAHVMSAHTYPKLPFHQMEPPSPQTSYVPPLPTEPPPIPTRPTSPSPQTPTIKAVSVSNTTEYTRNKAGELVDKLSQELKANTRFLESFPSQRTTRMYKEMSPSREFGTPGNYRVTPRSRGGSLVGARPAIPRFPGYGSPPNRITSPGVGRVAGWR